MPYFISVLASESSYSSISHHAPNTSSPIIPSTTSRLQSIETTPSVLNTSNYSDTTNALIISNPTTSPTFSSTRMLNSFSFTTSLHVYSSNITTWVSSSVINSSPLPKVSFTSVINTQSMLKDIVAPSSHISYTPPFTTPGMFLGGETPTAHMSYIPRLTSPTISNNFAALSATKISAEIPSSLSPYKEPSSTGLLMETSSQTTGLFSSRIQTVRSSASLPSLPTSSPTLESNIKHGEISTHSNTFSSTLKSTFTNQLNNSQLVSKTVTSMSEFISNMWIFYSNTSTINTMIPSANQITESAFSFIIQSTITFPNSSSTSPPLVTSVPSIVRDHAKTSSSSHMRNSFVTYSNPVKDSLSISINFNKQYTSNFVLKTRTLYQISPRSVIKVNSSTKVVDEKHSTLTATQTINFPINATLVHGKQFKPYSTLYEKSLTSNATLFVASANTFGTMDQTSASNSQVTTHPSLNISSTPKTSPTGVYIDHTPTDNHTTISLIMGSSPMFYTPLVTTSSQVYSSHITAPAYSSVINSSPLLTESFGGVMNNTPSVFMETITSSLNISHTLTNVTTMQIISPTRIATTVYLVHSTSISNHSYSSITASIAMESRHISSMFPSTLQRVSNITSSSMSSMSNTTNTLIDSAQVVNSANASSIYVQNTATLTLNIPQNFSTINNPSTQVVNLTVSKTSTITSSTTSGLVLPLTTSAVSISTNAPITSNNTSSTPRSTRILNTSYLTTSSLQVFSSNKNSTSMNITRYYASSSKFVSKTRTSYQIPPSIVAPVNSTTTQMIISKSLFTITQTPRFPINSTFVNATQLKPSSTLYDEKLSPNSTSKNMFLFHTTFSVATSNTFGATVNLTSTFPSQVTMHPSLNVSIPQTTSPTPSSTTPYLADPTGTHKRTTISLGRTPTLNASLLTTSSKVYSNNSTASTYSSVINSMPLFTATSTSVINNTLNVLKETITSSLNISYFPPSTSPSPETSNFSLISNIQADSTFFTSIAITSSMSIVVENSTVYLGNISTITSSIAASSATPYTVLNTTKTSFTTVTPTRNVSSTILEQASTLSSSFTTINRTTVPAQTSEASKSLINSTLVRIVPSSSTQTFTSVNVSTKLISTNMTLTSSTLPSVYSSKMSNNTPILVQRNSSSTISVSLTNITSPHAVTFSRTSELPRLNSSTVSLAGSTVQRVEINSTSLTPSSHLTVLLSTYTQGKNYSITVTKVQPPGETTRSSMRINATASASKLSSYEMNSSSVKINRTNQTVISSSFVTTTNISTKAIEPTSVVPNIPVTSTVRIPISLSKQRIVSFNATIVNKTYTRQLSNRSSTEYIETARVVRTAVSVQGTITDLPCFKR